MLGGPVPEILNEDTDVNPNSSNGESVNGYDPPDFNLILGAPDFAELFKKSKNQTVRDYERKAASAFKAVAVGSMQAGNWADAATFLWHGPGAATAIGQIADASPRAKQMIDMLTAPDSPWLVFAVTMLPLTAQILRNHEKDIQEIPAHWNMSRKARAHRKELRKETEDPPRFIIKLWRWHIPVRYKMRFRPWKTFASGVRSQTQEPNILAAKVFTDPALLSALDKIGVKIHTEAAKND